MIISLIIVDKGETIGRKGAERGREKEKRAKWKKMWEREGEKREKKQHEMKMGAKQMVNWFQLFPWLTVIAADVSVATANRSWTTPFTWSALGHTALLSLVF